MAGVLRRFFGIFLREPTSRPGPDTTAVPVRPPHMTAGSSFLQLEGTRFRLATGVDDFVNAATTNDRIALRFNRR